LNKVLGRYVILGFLLMMAMVFLSIGMSDSAEATPSIPISISSDADLDSFIASHGFYGDGTEGNPYLINNLEIDATGHTNAITLSNIHKHLMIADCTLTNAGQAGIAMNDVSNVTIQGNTINNNGERAVMLEHSNNVTMNANDCTNNPTDGFRIVYSSDISVFGNYITNSYDGIYLGVVQNSTFEINQFPLVDARGFFVVESDNNTFSDNSILDSTHGLYIDGSDNNIINGTICGFMGQQVIYLWQSNGNQVTNSTLAGTANYAVIYLSDSSRNTIFNNTVLDPSHMTMDGILLDASDNNIISNNALNGTYYGIHLSGSNGNTLANNTYTNHVLSIMGTGIILDSSNDNKVLNNTVNNSYAGIVLSSSNGNNLVGNICQDIDGEGIRISDSHSNLIDNNNCSYNAFNGIGIYSSGVSSYGNIVTYNNCTGNGVVGTGAGIYLYSSPDNIISFNKCDGNNYYGIWILNSPDNTVASNTVHHNDGSGIYVQGSSGTDVLSNIIYANGDSGIWLDSSDGCTMELNIATSNDDGVYLINSDHNVLFGNDLQFNADGIFLILSSFNSISFNECNWSHGEGGGIYLAQSLNNTLSNNYCNDGASNGIWINVLSNGNVLLNNTCSGNTQNGIYLRDSNDTLVSNNNCTDNVGRGIYLFTSSSNTLRNNTCNGNSEGIATYSTTIVFSNYNVIHNNTCNGNTNDGIRIQDRGSYTTITNNTCNGNTNRGVQVSASRYCEISNNTCIGNKLGIWLQSESDWNVIDNNNCSENAQAGIYLSDSYDCVVSNNTCNDNAPSILGSGIVIDNSKYDVIYKNDCTGNYFGIRLVYSSTDNVLRENELLSNLYGIYVETGSGRNMMDGNTITATNSGILLDGVVETVINNTHISGCSNGVYISNSDLTVVTNNTISSCLNGIYSYSADYLVISVNDISENINNGIELSGSIGSSVANNTCVGNAQNGIRVDSFNNGFIVNNTFNEAGTGIFLSTSSDNVVANNNCSLNTANPDFNYGIWLTSSYRNKITNNTCDQNGKSGFYLESSNENTLSNNNCSINGGHGIFLMYSNDNIIENSTCLDNTGDGIRLTISHRNELVNNTCASPNMFYGSINAGIYLEGADHNIIANNTCYNNGDGIHIYSGEYNTVSGNNLSYNVNYMGTKINIKIQSSNNNITNNTCLGSYVGLSISAGDDIRIEGNTFSYSSVGIEVYNFNHERLVIANNTCNGNGYGIYLHYVSDSWITSNTCEDNGNAGMYFDKRFINNMVANNTIRNNGYLLVDTSYGMAFAGSGLAIDGIGVYDNSYGNTIVNNIIEGNRLKGINLTSTTGNCMFGNVLIGNNGATSIYDSAHVQAYDDGTNFWNHTTYGNLWGDWTSPDANGDGIVDVVYSIDGGNSKDYNPLALSLVITSPADVFATRTASVNLLGTANSYFGLDLVTWYNAATSESGICTGTGTWNATVPLVAGDNLITVNFTDLNGMEAIVTITVLLDVVAPTLVITSPTEGAYVGSSVTVTWTGDDTGSGISQYNISLDGGEWFNTTASSRSFTGLNAGAHTAVVVAFDGVGNSFEKMVNFTVDATAPTVTINSPNEGMLNTTKSVTLVWTGSDAGSGVDHCEVSWEGIAPVTLGPGINTYTFSNLSDGSHLFTVTIYDKVGLSSSDTVTVIVDTQAPSLTITSPAPNSFIGVGSLTVNWASDDAGVGVSHFLISLDGGTAILLGPSVRTHTFDGVAEGAHSVIVTAFDLLDQQRQVGVSVTIDTVVPTLSIDSPEEGQLFNVTSVTVTWTTTDVNPGTVHIRVDSGSWVPVYEAQFVGTGLTSGSHAVYVKVTDAAGNSIERAVNITVDTDAPTLTFRSPTEGSLVNATQGMVEWEASDATSIVNNTQIRVDGGQWSDIGANTSWGYSLGDGLHTIEVKATDAAGNSATAKLNFTVDTVAPEAQVSPTGDDLELDLIILVEFSEAMNVTSVSMTVPGVTGALEWEGNAAMFAPSVLQYNRAYTVYVTGKDLAGNWIEVNWTFSTRSVGNLTGVILDGNGGPVANVTVTAGGEFIAVTDGNGRFTFLNLSVGTYQFEVDAEGFEPFTFNATVERGVTVDQGTVEMVPEEAEGDGDGDGSSILIYAIIALIVLAVVGAAAFVYLKKK